MRRLPLAAAMLLLSAAPAFASYYVYCDRGRISVDSRDNNQMRIARGSGFCQTHLSRLTCRGARRPLIFLGR